MIKSTRIVFATLALVAVAGLTACKSDNAATAEPAMEAKATPINTTCPFTGGKVNPAVTSVHDGKTLGFCCANCKGKYDKMGHDQQHAMMDKAK